MENTLLSSLKFATQPIAIIWSNEKPDDAMSLRQGKWACIIGLLLKSAINRKIVVFDKKRSGCPSGGTSLGFGNLYKNSPVDINILYKALCGGNSKKELGLGLKMALSLAGKAGFAPPDAVERMREGEGFKKDEKVIEEYLDQLPITTIEEKYVIIKPIELIDWDKDNVIVLTFFANPNQISALTQLANYDCPDLDRVKVIAGAGCQSVAMFPYEEAKKEKQHAIIGLTDITARSQYAKIIGEDILCFSVPLQLYHTLEKNCKGSFLEKRTWKKLIPD